MGLGAIIGAVGSIAAAGIGAASKGGLFGGGGPNLGEYSSRLNEAANQYILPFTDPSKWSLDLPGMAQQSINFGLQTAPSIDQANLTQLQTLLNSVMPGYQNVFDQMRGTYGNMLGLLPQMQAPISSMLAGNVPQDVQDQIRRNAAFTSLMGGSAGAGTGATGAITARDLGLTSLDLTQKGEALGSNLLTSGGNLLTSGQNLLGFARNYLMPQPVNPMSLLPLSDLISGAEWSKSAVFQANEAAYTAKANAAAAGIGAPSQSLGGTIGGITGGLQSLFQQGPSGKSPIESLLAMFGGGGGGGTTTVGGNIYPTGASGLLNTSADPNPDYAFF
jgi:hypothetical protein